MDDIIRFSRDSLNLLGSSNLFPESKISVGVGNTIVSMACFGVGPSIVAYAALKVLEDNDKVKTIIPFSNPITLPVTAFVMHQLLNMSASGLFAIGALYIGFQYFRNNKLPAQATIGIQK